MKKLRTQKVKIRAMVHSRTAATLGFPLKLQTPKAMARATVNFGVRRKPDDGGKRRRMPYLRQ